MTKRRATNLDMSERINFVLRAFAQGLQPFQMVPILMERYHLSERQSKRILAKARQELFAYASTDIIERMGILSNNLDALYLECKKDKNNQMILAILDRKKALLALDMKYYITAQNNLKMHCLGKKIMPRFY